MMDVCTLILVIVVKTTVLLADINDFVKVNEIYSTCKYAFICCNESCGRFAIILLYDTQSLTAKCLLSDVITESLMICSQRIVNSSHIVLFQTSTVSAIPLLLLKRHKCCKRFHDKV